MISTRTLNRQVQINSFSALGLCIVLLLGFTPLPAKPKSFPDANCQNPSSVSSKLPRSSDTLSQQLSDIREAVYRSYPETVLDKINPSLNHCDRSTILEYLDNHRLQSNIRTEVGTFYPTSLHAVDSGFKKVLSSDSTFLELGSGDGRVTLFAGLLGAEATGIEYDSTLVSISRTARQSLLERGHERLENVRFLREDYFKHNWSQYDVVFYYETKLETFAVAGEAEPSSRKRIKNKLLEELPKGSIFLCYYENSIDKSHPPTILPLDQFRQTVVSNHLVSYRRTTSS